MNVEFMQINDKSFMVTNEKGYIEERDIEFNDIEKQLTLENNFAHINNIINELEHYVGTTHKFDKESYLSSLEIPIVSTFAGVAVGTLYNHDNLVLGGVCVGAAWSALALIYTGIKNATHVSDEKKKKEAYQAVLEKAYIIRSSILTEMQSIRSNTGAKDNYINVPISILEDTDFMFSTKHTLNDEYKEHAHAKRLQKELPIK